MSTCLISKSNLLPFCKTLNFHFEYKSPKIPSLFLFSFFASLLFNRQRVSRRREQNPTERNGICRVHFHFFLPLLVCRLLLSWSNALLYVRVHVCVFVGVCVLTRSREFTSTNWNISLNFVCFDGIYEHWKEMHVQHVYQKNITRLIGEEKCRKFQRETNPRNFLTSRQVIKTYFPQNTKLGECNVSHNPVLPPTTLICKEQRLNYKKVLNFPGVILRAKSP